MPGTKLNSTLTSTKTLATHIPKHSRSKPISKPSPKHRSCETPLIGLPAKIAGIQQEQGDQSKSASNSPKKAGLGFINKLA